MGVALLLSLALAVPAALRLGVDPRVASLLPEGEPAAEAYRELAEVFGGNEATFVVANVPESDLPVAANVHSRAEELIAALPGTLSARAGLTSTEERRLREEFLPGLIWSLPESALDEVARRLEPDALEHRFERLRRRLATPASVGLAPWWRADPLELLELSPLGEVSADAPIDPVTGLYVGRDPRHRLIIVETAGEELDAAAGRLVERQLDEVEQRLKTEFESAVGLVAVGGSLYAAADERVLRRDLSTTLPLSLAGCALLLWLGLRSFRAPLLLAAIVVVGGLWTAALWSLFSPVVLALAVGCLPIVVGLGVDYGVHFLARARAAESLTRERRWRLVLERVGRPAFASAASTAAAALVLALAGWPLLRQLGFLLALGVGSLLVATFAIGGWSLAGAAAKREEPAGGIERRLSLVSERARGSRGLLLAAAGLIAIVGALGLVRVEFDTDLAALRPADSPLFAVERTLAEQFGIGADTAAIVVTAADTGQALRTAAAVSGWLETREPSWRINAPMATARPLGPEERARRAERLGGAERAAEIREALERAGLDPTALASAWQWLESPTSSRWTANEPAGGATGPSPLSGVVSSEGRALAVVRVRSSGPADPALWEELEERWPEARWASAGRLGAALESRAIADFRRLAVAGLFVVVLVLAVVAGGPRRALLACLPAIFGGVVTVGALGWAGIPLDLVSLCVLPIVLGLGVDDGLHVVLSGARDRVEAVRGSGRGLLLTTVTTVWAFGSLGASRLPALRMGGLLVAIGVTVCFVATVTVLPALERER